MCFCISLAIAISAEVLTEKVVSSLRSFLTYSSWARKVSKTSSLRRSKSKRAKSRILTFEVFEQRRLLAGLINAPLTSVQRDALISGLTDVASWTQSETNTQQLNQPLAILNQSVSQLAQTQNMLQSGVIQPAVLAAQGATNTDQFVAALAGLSHTQGDLTITVNPSSVVGGQQTTSLGDELMFSIVVDVRRQTPLNIPLSLGTGVQEAGLTAGSSVALQVESLLHFDFSFGIALDTNLASDQAFFLRPNSLTVGSSVNLSNLNLPAQIGMLDTQIVGGSIVLNASTNLLFTNPDADILNNITLYELKHFGASEIATQSNLASVSTGNLPITATLGTQVLDATSLGATPTLAFTSTNVFAGSDSIKANGNAAFQELTNFVNITPSGLLTALDRAGLGLQGMASQLDVNKDLGGLGYTTTQASDIVDFRASIQKTARGLYDPILTGSQPTHEGSAFSLDTDASFSLRINDAETVPVNIVRTTQGFHENLAAFINRSLPGALYNRVTVSQSTFAGVGNVLSFKAVDPSITKLEMLISDASNSISKNLGFNPGQVSQPAFHFNSVQGFATQFAQLTNLGATGVVPQYDVSSHTFSFRTNLQSQSYTQTVPLDFSSGLGPLTYLSPSIGTFTVTPSVNGRLGIALDQLQTVLTATGDAPSNGVLSATANLYVSLNGASGIHLTVARDTTNTSLDDLVADINAAIGLSNLHGKLTAGRTGARLTLTAATGSGLQVTAQAADTASTQLFLVGNGMVTQWSNSVSFDTATNVQLVSQLTSNNLSGSASLGILPVSLSGGVVTIGATAGATLNQKTSVGGLGKSSTAILTLSPLISTLAGHFVPNVDSTLGVTAGAQRLSISD